MPATSAPLARAMMIPLAMALPCALIYTVPSTVASLPSATTTACWCLPPLRRMIRPTASGSLRGSPLPYRETKRIGLCRRIWNGIGRWCLGGEYIIGKGVILIRWLTFYLYGPLQVFYFLHLNAPFLCIREYP